MRYAGGRPGWLRETRRISAARVVFPSLTRSTPAPLNACRTSDWARLVEPHGALEVSLGVREQPELGDQVRSEQRVPDLRGRVITRLPGLAGGLEIRHQQPDPSQLDECDQVLDRTARAARHMLGLLEEGDRVRVRVPVACVRSQSEEARSELPGQTKLADLWQALQRDLLGPFVVPEHG